MSKMEKSARPAADNAKSQYCYFSTSPNHAKSLPTVVVEFNKLTAVPLTSRPLVRINKTNPFEDYHNTTLPSGIADELLKPPRA